MSPSNCICETQSQRVLIWDYKNADIPSINCTIDNFDWVIHATVKMLMNKSTTLTKQS